ncbi:21332_t:CDS:2, partial [Gigaspora margarita]
PYLCAALIPVHCLSVGGSITIFLFLQLHHLFLLPVANSKFGDLMFFF